MEEIGRTFSQQYIGRLEWLLSLQIYVNKDAGTTLNTFQPRMGASAQSTGNGDRWRLDRGGSRPAGGRYLRVVPESEVFTFHAKPLLNGLFGVEKHEDLAGIPIYRLIMNLVPLNSLCQGLHGGYMHFTTLVRNDSFPCGAT